MDGNESTNELAQIFSPQTKKLNPQKLKKLIDNPSTQYELIMDALDSLTKLTHQSIEKKEAHPLEALSESQTLLFFQSLLQMKSIFKQTIYEIKIDDFIQSCTKKSIFAPKNIQQVDATKQQFSKLKLPTFDQLIQDPKLLNGKFSTQPALFYYVDQELLPLMRQKVLSMNNHGPRYQFILKCLKLLGFAFSQTQIEIRIEKNTLIENRVFLCPLDKQIQSKQSNMIGKMSILINQSLLCPSDMAIQGTLLTLLKRFYRYWPQKVDSVFFLNLRNISLYSHPQKDESLLKEAAMALYRITNDKSDIKLIDLIDHSSDLQFLKQSQFYNSKSFAYSNEYKRIYDLKVDQFPFCLLHQYVGNRQTWVKTVIITKPNSLLAWQFFIQNYDIRFGIFKVSKIKRYTIEDYESKQQCKPIIKLDKHGDKGQKRVKGSAFIKNGVYHVVFDNSYSMVRGKDIVYCVKEMESL